MDRNFAAAILWRAAFVATREGGVDRNIFFAVLAFNLAESPPARVAWIETCISAHFLLKRYVATREGGVDRNFKKPMPTPCSSCRHPRGWRG